MPGLTVAQSVEIGNLIVERYERGRNILGLVEMHERFSKRDWGESEKYEKNMRSN